MMDSNQDKQNLTDIRRLIAALSATGLNFTVSSLAILFVIWTFYRELSGKNTVPLVVALLSCAVLHFFVGWFIAGGLDWVNLPRKSSDPRARQTSQRGR